MIHRRLQVFLRRYHFNSRYLQYKDQWPIYAKDIQPPLSWKGWPDGKRFALVMTHDVESAVGQDRIPNLMRLEQDLGIISSFNFIPERYKVSQNMREMLVRNGFEVGVHDLKHDGKLYVSEKDFLEAAAKINGYMKDWGSVGFRSGAMLHDLDLIHALHIEYDGSTFDFDPFEPQPEGERTIFPFWVAPNRHGKGYVELPYTMPQDFTLFILKREKNIDIWKKKLDWVVANGGMVLLITHPDYMNFDDRPNGPEEYSCKLYREFLEYVIKNYVGEYWNALPKDLSRFWNRNMVTPPAE